MGFCHRTESDLFLFLFVTLWYFQILMSSDSTHAYFDNAAQMNVLNVKFYSVRSNIILIKTNVNELKHVILSVDNHVIILEDTLIAHPLVLRS